MKSITISRIFDDDPHLKVGVNVDFHVTIKDDDRSIFLLNGLGDSKDFTRAADNLVARNKTLSRLFDGLNGFGTHDGCMEADLAAKSKKNLVGYSIFLVFSLRISFDWRSI